MLSAVVVYDSCTSTRTLIYLYMVCVDSFSCVQALFNFFFSISASLVAPAALIGPPVSNISPQKFEPSLSAFYRCSFVCSVRFLNPFSSRWSQIHILRVFFSLSTAHRPRRYCCFSLCFFIPHIFDCGFAVDAIVIIPKFPSTEIHYVRFSVLLVFRENWCRYRS